MILDDIKNNLEWLRVNKASANIVNISIVLNDLSIQSVTLGELKSDAYDVSVDAEDEYKRAYAEFTTSFEGSMAKAEQAAEIVLYDKKRTWSEAKKLYKRYDIWLDRLDKVLDAYKQRVSVEKQTNAKHIT